ncbi:MAG TPA: hypothetical protein VHR15_04270, partial [Ktedonobacterales bacterium]|nr:hypothetical protein [Ktedonobacterales bacterium]
GQRPHRGQTFSELSGSILSGKYQPLREVLPGVAPQLERIVGRAMARELSDRYESAADLWRDLRAFQTASAPVSASQGPASHVEAPRVDQTGAPQRQAFRRVSLKPLSSDETDATWPRTPDDRQR